MKTIVISIDVPDDCTVQIRPRIPGVTDKRDEEERLRSTNVVAINEPVEPDNEEFYKGNLIVGDTKMVAKKSIHPPMRTSVSEKGWQSWHCGYCDKKHSSKQGCAAHMVRCPKNPKRKIWTRAQPLPK